MVVFLPTPTQVLRPSVTGATEFDIRDRETISATYAIPGRPGFGQVLEGWSVNLVTIIQSGLPWGVSDTSTDFAGTGDITNTWDFLSASSIGALGNPKDFEAIRNYIGVPLPPSGAAGIPWYPGANQTITCVVTGGLCTAVGQKVAGSTQTSAGGVCYQQANAIGPLAVASLANLGCYALGNSVLIPPAYGSYGTLAFRSPFRDAGYYNMDFSFTKVFRFKERFTAQFRGEIFNILNHPDFVNPAGGPGGGGASLNPTKAGSTGSGLALVSNTPDIASSNPVLGSGGPRAIQIGLKLGF